jgi:Tol biopolymer transport system component
VFTSGSGESADLWSSASDGADLRQMTFDRPSEFDLAYDRTRGDIYFAKADDLPHVWKLGMKDESPVRVTDDEDYNPDVSQDGKWLVFDSWKSGTRSVWKLEIGTDDTATLVRSGARNPKISPDGQRLVCLYHDDQEKRDRVAILTFPSGQVISVFDFPLTASQEEFHWSPDGKSIHFVDTHDGVSNIRALDMETGTLGQVTAFLSDQIFRFAWSHDGQSLAVAHGQTTSDIVMLTVTE